MEPKNEKEEEISSEKIDEAQLALEYMNKDKEKLKPNKNDFNKIVYIEYENVFTKINPELDFLYDYSKILGSENSDPKIIQWQLANLDRLFKYGIDISVLKKRNNQQNLGIYKMSNIVENISYRLQKHGKLAPSDDIARILPKRDEDQIQINEEEEDEEDINIENEDSKNDAPLNNNNLENNNLNNDNQINKKIINDDIDNNNNINIDLNNNNNKQEKNENKDIINNDNNNDNNNINIDNNNIQENQENKISIINLNKKPTNNQNGYNGYEDNFYDKNDSFIDDDFDNSSEDNELLFKLTLGHGNYTEQEILNNLKKSNRKDSLKKKKKMKNIKGKKTKEGKKLINNKKEKKLKLGHKLNKILSTKTKRKPEEDNNNSTTNKKKKKININIESIENLNIEKIDEIFKLLITEYDTEINTDHEKESFLRRNIKIIEELYKKNSSDFIKVLSNKFQIEINKANILIEYELFKSVLENKYSNLSKFLNKLYTLLKENGVMEINTMEQLNKYIESVPEIEKSLNHVSDNIINYRDKFNSYMGKHYSDMYIINSELENFIQNIKDRNLEYITKIASKFNEYEDKFKIKIKKEIFIEYIKNKYPNTDFTEDLNSDINNRKFSLETFIDYDIGKKADVFLQVETNDIKQNNNNNEAGNFVVQLENISIDNNNIDVDNADNKNKGDNQLKLFTSKIELNNTKNT